MLSSLANNGSGNETDPVKSGDFLETKMKAKIKEKGDEKFDESDQKKKERKESPKLEKEWLKMVSELRIID